MINRKTAIGRQFNRSASGSYDNHDRVQRIMADRLAKFLVKWTSECDLKSPDILEIGCGTGTLTAILADQWSCSSITALDLAPAMILAAEQRVSSSAADYSGDRAMPSSRVQFKLADVEMWAANAPAASFDLIVSSACFQWLGQPKQTLDHLRRLLRTGGLLAFATFGPDTFRELHTSFDEVYRAHGLEPQRHGLSYQSAEQWTHMLKETGFSRMRYERLFQTEKYASAREFLQSVKALGASASEAAASHTIGSRRLFADMFKAYEAKFSTLEGVTATYEVLLIQALAT